MPATFFDIAQLLPQTPLTSPAPWLRDWLFLGFVLHIIFMNAVVGVACISLTRLLRPVKKGAPAPEAPPLLDTLPKGLALVVNLGVLPLLFLQAAYGYVAYNSAVLMAVWWLSIMGVVMMAYYGLYFATSPSAPRGARILALTLALGLLFLNAFTLVNKAVIVQSPALWLQHAASPYGIFIAVRDPQLIPRYLHVLVASVAVGGLCLGVFAGRNLRGLERRGASPAELLEAATEERKGFSWYTHATALQLVIGTWFLLSLPEAQRRMFLGGDAFAAGLFALALLAALASLAFARKKRGKAVIATVGLAILCMAGMRTLLRISLLSAYPSPPDSALDYGPALVFLVCLVLSAFAVLHMFRLFRSQDGARKSRVKLLPSQRIKG